MFVIAVILLVFGYALMYTGGDNLKKGGEAPGLLDNLGWSVPSTAPKESIAPFTPTPQVTNPQTAPEFVPL